MTPKNALYRVCTISSIILLAILVSFTSYAEVTAKEIESSFIKGDFEVKVGSVKVTDYVAEEYSGGYYLFERIQGRKFVIVSVSITNIGKTEHYSPDFYASINTSERYRFIEWSPPHGVHSEEYNPKRATEDEIEMYGCHHEWGKLYPGESVSDDYVFEIPEGTEPLCLHISKGVYKAVVDLVNPKPRLEPIIDIKEAKIQKEHGNYVVNITCQNIGSFGLVRGKVIVYLDEKEVNSKKLCDGFDPQKSEIIKVSIIEEKRLLKGEHEVKIDFLDERGNVVGEKILKFETAEEIPGFEAVFVILGLLLTAYIIKRR